MKTRKQIKPGTLVYVRWMGEQEFEVVEKSDQTKTKFPHWICRIKGSFGLTDEYWIFPQIHMSTTPIKTLTGESNRKQLAMFPRIGMAA